MGDVFWDYSADRDGPAQFRPPEEIAVEAVEAALREVVLDALSMVRSDASLRSEYETMTAELPDTPRDEEIIAALVAKGAWTMNGANAILMLARNYVAAILRNALALAAAMGIEDGESGL
jgi:hypothetical protein